MHGDARMITELQGVADRLRCLPSGLPALDKCGENAMRAMEKLRDWLFAVRATTQIVR